MLVPEPTEDLWQEVELGAGLWVLDHVRSEVNEFVLVSLADFLDVFSQLDI